MRSGQAALPALLAVLVTGCGSGAHPQTPRSSITTTHAARTAGPQVRGAHPRLVVRASQTGWRLPAAVYRTVAVARGSQIFVFGGHDPAGATIDTVDELDTATGGARIAGRLAVPTHGAAAAALGGRLLVFGGASTAVHDLVQRFEPGRGAARVVGRLPAPRADVTAAVVSHTVLLIGRFDGIGPQRDVWASHDGVHFQPIARLPEAVRYAAVVSQGESAYVFGGLISGGEYDGQFSNLIQRVRLGPHPTATVVGHLPEPLAHAMGALIDGRVLVLGGSTPHGPSSAILRFDPARRQIARVARLPHPLTDAAVATIGETAYLLGGISTGPRAEVIKVRWTRSTRPSPARPSQRSGTGAEETPVAVFQQPPYMGVACHTPNSIACDRVGLSVWLRRPAVVTATIAGARLKRDDPHLSYVAHYRHQTVYVYAGFLQPASLTTRLHVLPASGTSSWSDSNAPSPLVRFRIAYRNGKTAITQQHVWLSAGWG
jgi:hypothetical protein